ncbi:MAG: hypothetical protein K9J13_14810 [Saprospiraceae bacterium]|nr:hypothetical protein [Saprospiraceae bacterium]
MKKVLLSIIAALFVVSISQAQVSVKDSVISTAFFTAHYQYQIPGGDLSGSFLGSSGIGSSFMYKTNNNWLFGFDYNFFFRDTVKGSDTILKNISTSLGQVIDGNGIYAEINMYERGFYSTAKIGKLFPVFGPNDNSGICVIAGGGLLQHKIRIENTDNTAPQLSGDYKKGYDRLTNGFALSEFVGYMYMGNRKIVSFYAGFEFVQAWTQSRRDYDFVLMGKDDKKRFDTLSGFKFGWIIPLYKRKPQKYYYN